MERPPEVVVAETVDYLVRFLEVPHPAFGNLPVCPFSKSMRRTRVKWVVGRLSADRVVRTPFGDHVLLWFIDTRKDLPHAEVLALEAQLTRVLPDCVVLSGGPNDPFVLNGVKTRQEPYPNIQLFKKEVLANYQATLALKTGYYGDKNRGRGHK